MKPARHLLPSIRSRSHLLLDALFAAWMLHMLVTGNLIPAPIEDLINPPEPISVLVEPDGAPHDSDNFRPNA